MSYDPFEIKRIIQEAKTGQLDSRSDDEIAWQVAEDAIRKGEQPPEYAREGWQRWRTSQKDGMLSSFGKGFKSGIEGSKASFQGGLALGLRALGAAGKDSFLNRPYQGLLTAASANLDEAFEERGFISSFGDVRQFSDLFDLAGSFTGQAAQSVIESGASMVAGAALGSATAPGAGTVGGGVAGLFGKGAAKKAIKAEIREHIGDKGRREAMEEYVDRTFASNTVGEAYKDVADKLLEAGVDAGKDALVAGMRQKATRQHMLGMSKKFLVGQSFVQNSGEMFSDLVHRGQDTDLAAWTSLGTGTINAALDTWFESKVLDSVFGLDAGAARKIAKRHTLEGIRRIPVKWWEAANLKGNMGKGFLAEGVTEALQEAVNLAGVEIADPNATTTSLQLAITMADAFSIGGISGGAFGGVRAMTDYRDYMTAQVNAINTAEAVRALDQEYLAQFSEEGAAMADQLVGQATQTRVQGAREAAEAEGRPGVVPPPEVKQSSTGTDSSSRLSRAQYEAMRADLMGQLGNYAEDSKTFLGQDIHTELEGIELYKQAYDKAFTEGNAKATKVVAEARAAAAAAIASSKEGTSSKEKKAKAKRNAEASVVEAQIAEEEEAEQLGSVDPGGNYVRVFDESQKDTSMYRVLRALHENEKNPQGFSPTELINKGDFEEVRAYILQEDIRIRYVNKAATDPDNATPTHPNQTWIHRDAAEGQVRNLLFAVEEVPAAPTGIPLNSIEGYKDSAPIIKAWFKREINYSGRGNYVRQVDKTEADRIEADKKARGGRKKQTQGRPIAELGDDLSNYAFFKPEGAPVAVMPQAVYEFFISVLDGPSYGSGLSLEDDPAFQTLSGEGRYPQVYNNPYQLLDSIDPDNTGDVSQLTYDDQAVREALLEIGRRQGLTSREDWASAADQNSKYFDNRDTRIREFVDFLFAEPAKPFPPRIREAIARNNVDEKDGQLFFLVKGKLVPVSSEGAPNLKVKIQETEEVLNQLKREIPDDADTGVVRDIYRKVLGIDDTSFTSKAGALNTLEFRLADLKQRQADTDEAVRYVNRLNGVEQSNDPWTRALANYPSEQEYVQGTSFVDAVGNSARDADNIKKDEVIAVSKKQRKHAEKVEERRTALGQLMEAYPEMGEFFPKDDKGETYSPRYLLQAASSVQEGEGMQIILVGPVGPEGSPKPMTVWVNGSQVTNPQNKGGQPVSFESEQFFGEYIEAVESDKSELSGVELEKAGRKFIQTIFTQLHKRIAGPGLTYTGEGQEYASLSEALTAREGGAPVFVLSSEYRDLSVVLEGEIQDPEGGWVKKAIFVPLTKPNRSADGAVVFAHDQVRKRPAVVYTEKGEEKLSRDISNPAVEEAIETSDRMVIPSAEGDVVLREPKVVGLAAGRQAEGTPRLRIADPAVLQEKDNPSLADAVETGAGIRHTGATISGFGDKPGEGAFDFEGTSDSDVVVPEDAFGWNEVLDALVEGTGEFDVWQTLDNEKAGELLHYLAAKLGDRADVLVTFIEGLGENKIGLDGMRDVLLRAVHFFGDSNTDSGFLEKKYGPTLVKAKRIGKPLMPAPNPDTVASVIVGGLLDPTKLAQVAAMDGKALQQAASLSVRTSQDGKGIPAKDELFQKGVRGRVTRLAKRLGIPEESISVVGFEDGSNVEGDFDLGTRKIRINANLPAHRAIKVLLHELSHKGLTYMFRRDKTAFGRFLRFQKSLEKTHPGELNKLAKRYYGDRTYSQIKSWEKRVVIEEFLAAEAETSLNTAEARGMWQKIVDGFRDILRAFDPDPEWTDRDIRHLMLQSVSNGVRAPLVESAGVFADNGVRQSLIDEYIDAKGGRTKEDFKRYREFMSVPVPEGRVQNVGDFIEWASPLAEGAPGAEQFARVLQGMQAADPSLAGVPLFSGLPIGSRGVYSSGSDSIELAEGWRGGDVRVAFHEVVHAQTMRKVYREEDYREADALVVGELQLLGEFSADVVLRAPGQVPYTLIKKGETPTPSQLEVLVNIYRKDRNREPQHRQLRSPDPEWMGFVRDSMETGGWLGMDSKTIRDRLMIARVREQLASAETTAEERKIAEAVSALYDIFTFHRSRLRQHEETEYAASNFAEFLAESMSDHDVMVYLASRKSEGRRMLRVVWDWIGQILGLSDRSLLDDVVALTFDIVSAPYQPLQDARTQRPDRMEAGRLNYQASVYESRSWATKFWFPGEGELRDAMEEAEERLNAWLDQLWENPPLDRVEMKQGMQRGRYAGSGSPLSVTVPRDPKGVETLGVPRWGSRVDSFIKGSSVEGDFEELLAGIEENLQEMGIDGVRGRHRKARKSKMEAELLRDQARLAEDRADQLHQKQGGGSESLLGIQKPRAQLEADYGVRHSFAHSDYRFSIADEDHPKSKRAGAHGGGASWIVWADRGKWPVDWNQVRSPEDVGRAAAGIFNKFEGSVPALTLPVLRSVDSYLAKNKAAVEAGTGPPELEQLLYQYDGDWEQVGEAFLELIRGRQMDALRSSHEYLKDNYSGPAPDPNNEYLVELAPFQSAMMAALRSNLSPSRVSVPENLEGQGAALAEVAQRFFDGWYVSPKVMLTDFKEKAAEIAAKTAEIVVGGLDGGEWVTLPQGKDPKTFATWRALSRDNWCTSKGMEQTYAPQGKMDVYVKDKEPVLAIRYKGAEVVEIQSPANDSTIPSEWAQEVKNYTEGTQLSSRARETLNKALAESEFDTRAEALAEEGASWELLPDHAMNRLQTGGEWVYDAKFEVGEEDRPMALRLRDGTYALKLRKGDQVSLQPGFEVSIIYGDLVVGGGNTYSRARRELSVSSFAGTPSFGNTVREVFGSLRWEGREESVEGMKDSLLERVHGALQTPYDVSPVFENLLYVAGDVQGDLQAPRLVEIGGDVKGGKQIIPALTIVGGNLAVFPGWSYPNLEKVGSLDVRASGRPRANGTSPSTTLPVREARKLVVEGLGVFPNLEEVGVLRVKEGFLFETDGPAGHTLAGAKFPALHTAGDVTIEVKNFDTLPSNRGIATPTHYYPTDLSALRNAQSIQLIDSNTGEKMPLTEEATNLLPEIIDSASSPRTQGADPNKRYSLASDQDEISDGFRRGIDEMLTREDLAQEIIETGKRMEAEGYRIATRDLQEVLQAASQEVYPEDLVEAEKYVNKQVTGLANFAAVDESGNPIPIDMSVPVNDRLMAEKGHEIMDTRRGLLLALQNRFRKAQEALDPSEVSRAAALSRAIGRVSARIETAQNELRRDEFVPGPHNKNGTVFQIPEVGDTDEVFESDQRTVTIDKEADVETYEGAIIALHEYILDKEDKGETDTRAYSMAVTQQQYLTDARIGGFDDNFVNSELGWLALRMMGETEQLNLSGTQEGKEAAKLINRFLSQRKLVTGQLHAATNKAARAVANAMSRLGMDKNQVLTLLERVMHHYEDDTTLAESMMEADQVAGRRARVALDALKKDPAFTLPGVGEVRLLKTIDDLAQTQATIARILKDGNVEEGLYVEDKFISFDEKGKGTWTAQTRKHIPAGPATFSRKMSGEMEGFATSLKPEERELNPAIVGMEELMELAYKGASEDEIDLAIGKIASSPELSRLLEISRGVGSRLYKARGIKDPDNRARPKAIRDLPQGDASQFFSGLVAAHGGTRQQYIDDFIGFFRQAQQAVALKHGSAWRPNVNTSNLAEALGIGGVLAHARSEVDWPQEAYNFNVFTGVKDLQIRASGIAAFRAWGRDGLALTNALGALKTRATDSRIKLGLVGFGGMITNAMYKDKELLARVGGDEKQLKHHLNMVKLESLPDKTVSALNRYFIRYDRGTEETGKLRQAFNWTINGMLQNPGTAIQTLNEIFPFFHEGLNKYSAYGTGETIKNLFNEGFLKPLAITFGMKPEKAKGIEQFEEATGAQLDPESQRTLRDILAPVTESRGEMPGELIEKMIELTRKPIGNHDGQAGVRLLAPFTHVLESSRKAILLGNMSKIVKQMTELVAYYEGGGAEQYPPGFAKSAARQEYLNRFAEVTGMEMSLYARKAKANKEAGRPMLDRRMWVGLLDWTALLQGETHIGNLPIGLNSGTMGIMSTLLKWTLVRGNEINRKRYNNKGERERVAVWAAKMALMVAPALGAGVGANWLREMYTEHILQKRRNRRQLEETFTGDLDDLFLGAVEQVAASGALGYWGDVLDATFNVATGDSTYQGLSLDKKVVAVSQMQSFFNAARFMVSAGGADYTHVGRPLLNALGMTSFIHTLHTVDRLGFELFDWEQNTARRGHVANTLSAWGRVMEYEARSFYGGAKPTPRSLALTRLEFAIYEDNPEDFDLAWKAAINMEIESGKARTPKEAEKNLRTSLRNRHPLKKGFRSLSNKEYLTMLEAMDRGSRETTEKAVARWNKYLKGVKSSGFEGTK